MDIKFENGKPHKDNESAQFDMEMGQKATVQRDDQTGSAAEHANRSLRKIGSELQPEAHKDAVYLGSAAVHIYQSPILKHLFLISQTDTLQGVHEALAIKAAQDLTKSMQKFYGRRPQTLRSGF